MIEEKGRSKEEQLDALIQDGIDSGSATLLNMAESIREAKENREMQANEATRRRSRTTAELE